MFSFFGCFILFIGYKDLGRCVTHINRKVMVKLCYFISQLLLQFIVVYPQVINLPNFLDRKRAAQHLFLELIEMRSQDFLVKTKPANKLISILFGKDT